MDFTASFRWWKRTVSSDDEDTFGQCAQFWGLFFFLFFSFAHNPPSHNTNLYLLNGLCQYKWTHPEPLDLPILILTFSSFQLEVEC